MATPMTRTEVIPLCEEKPHPRAPPPPPHKPNGSAQQHLADRAANSGTGSGAVLR